MTDIRILDAGAAASEPSEANRAERAVVEHLIERVTERLTDRAGERHPPPWEPKQAVRIGVLRPVVDYSAGEDVGGSEEAVEPEDGGQPEPAPFENLQALGLDFVVRPSGAPDKPLSLSVDVQFAIYLPENPTKAEAEVHFARQQEEAQALAESEADEASTDDNDGVGSDGGNKPEEDVERDASRARQLGAGQNVPVQVAWRRVPIVVRDLDIAVRPDGEHVTDGGALTAAFEPELAAHFARPDAARPFRAARVIPIDELRGGSYEEAVASRVDTTWSPDGGEAFEAELNVFAEPLPSGDVLVSVSLLNSKVYAGKPFLDYTLYDCQFEVTVAAEASLEPQRFSMAPKDYRYVGHDTVPGHGRGCVAVEGTRPNSVRTETLPIFVQQRVEPRSGHVPDPRWDRLATDPAPILAGIRDGMRRERNEWQRWLQDQDPQVRDAAQRELDGFIEEMERFELGMDAMQADPRLSQAFCLANQAFADLYASKPQINSWRLFQLVYIVSHLPSLVAREQRNVQRFVKELESVDVLWFPTGGGKTEAYLGLIVTAALYDRLRGKDRGVTAWLKFPLRMLSVQQLVRVLRILVAADQLRVRHGLPGAPFELGYLVGGGNTPNSLHWPSRDSWWPGFDKAANAEEGEYDHHRLVGQCPFCGDTQKIGLVVDEEAYRLKHVCRACEQTLPVYMSDEEVYRYQPTVVVSTVDKVTGFAHFGEFTSFVHGPRVKCPVHGYIAFGKCSARDRCDVDARSYQQISGWTDPVPALMIQDEMHLIREELGAFEAHFEGLLAELQRSGPSQLPSKILAATATIEQFEDQLRQVYGRAPRRFPSPGFTLERSFYSEQTPDTQRIFMGVMPTGSGVSKVEVSGIIQTELLRTIHELQNDLAAAQKVVGDAGIVMSHDEVRDLLFFYELSLGFVNSKANGANIREDFDVLNAELSALDEDQALVKVLTGEVPVGELAEAIDLIEDADLSVPRPRRLRAIIATSVVSHGVDLERLNAMVMAGLPSTTADYIQATSRSGRTHVGLVATVFDHISKREASTFMHFLSTHRFLDRLVEPVPVNKYAKNAVVRTLPSLVVALLWDLARDPAYNAPTKGIRYTRDFKPWWNTNAAALDQRLLDRLKASYRAPVSNVNPTALEDRLAEAAEQRWTTIEKGRMLQYDADKLVDLFAERVLSSLRDVDEPVEFAAMPQSSRLYDELVR